MKCDECGEEMKFQFRNILLKESLYKCKNGHRKQVKEDEEVRIEQQNT